MPQLNDIFITVTLIIPIQTNEPSGSATGFFYVKHNKLFLVTNRHCVINEEERFKPKKLKAKLHTNPSNLTENDEYEIPLYDNNEKNWLEHPTIPGVDVVCIPINKQEIQGRFIIKAFCKDNFLPTNYLLSPSEDVFVVGYPRGFHDRLLNLPVLRNAMVASAYPSYFEGKPFFLIDSNLHEGTSGSPVITKVKNTWQTSNGNTAIVPGDTMYFLGINSGCFIFGDGQNSGLNIVWYNSLLEEIIG